MPSSQTSRNYAHETPIDVPALGTRGAQRGDEKTSVQPSDVVIVEGHLIYWSEDLRDLMDIKTVS